MKTHTTTSKGTPYASTWDAAWADRVNAAESAIGRRVCGARTLSGAPCTLTSDHPTGRCRYHGGTDAIGAPVGNQNARTHGLYARRLQRCGTHCPMWQHCPFADSDVLALEPAERPICAYEASEYEVVLEEIENNDEESRSRFDDVESSPSNAQDPIRENPSNPPNPRTHSTRHNLALLQVMVSRAAAALSVTAFTDEVSSEGERYQMHTTKVHPALEAFLRLSREHRAALAQYDRDRERMLKAETEWAKHQRPLSLADVAAPLLERADGVIEQALEAENERQREVECLREANKRLIAQLDAAHIDGASPPQEPDKPEEPARTVPNAPVEPPTPPEGYEPPPLIATFIPSTRTNRNPRAP